MHGKNTNVDSFCVNNDGNHYTRIKLHKLIQNQQNNKGFNYWIKVSKILTKLV